jgi:hypothetical protein
MDRLGKNHNVYLENRSMVDPIERSQRIPPMLMDAVQNTARNVYVRFASQEAIEAQNAHPDRAAQALQNFKVACEELLIRGVGPQWQTIEMNPSNALHLVRETLRAAEIVNGAMRFAFAVTTFGDLEAHDGYNMIAVNALSALSWKS